MRKLLKRLLILAILGGLAVAGLYAYNRGAISAGPDLARIPTFPVKPMEFDVRLSSVGALEAASSRNIVAPYSGKVVKVLPEGELVNLGDPVVWLETTDFEDKLKDDEVDLEVAKSELAQSQEDYNLLLRQQELDEAKAKAQVDYEERKLADAKNQEEITKKLVESALASVSDLETRKLERLQSELALEQAKIELEKFVKSKSSEAQISLSKIEGKKVMVEKYEREVAERKKDIEDAILRSPGSGHISYLTVRISGQNTKVSEGAQVYERSSLIQVPDSKTMLAKVPISELDISKVQVGQRTEVSIQAFPKNKYKGKVTQKSFVPLTDTSFKKMVMGDDSAVKEFEVTVELEGEDPAMRQGMTASVRIIVEEPAKRLAIPQVAVSTEGRNAVVFRKTANGYEKVQVKAGLTNDNYVEILSGVSEGDTLYLRDPSKVMDSEGEQKKA